MKDPDEDRLLDHSYDGIQEYDNPMPRWWVITFWATIVFAILYLLNVPGIGNGAGRIADYESDMARAKATQLAAAPSGVPDSAALEALAHDPATIAAGKEVYATYCAACHRVDGGGQIGPNLTDDAWIHGGALADIRSTISSGVLAKGMPEWGRILKPDQVDAAAAYVRTLSGSNPPNAKSPEGVRGTP